MQTCGQWELPDADTYFAPVLKPEGFEIDKLEAALGHVRQWRVAVDAGAHIGTWSWHMAKRFRTVLAFEPARDTFECLARNLGDEPNVVPVRAAMGASRVWAGIHDDRSRPGNTGARHLGAGDDFAVEPLDDYRIDELDFLKLDVEGYEYFALLGAEKTIRTCAPVVCMEVKDFGGRFGVETEAAARLLLSWGAREAARLRNDRVYVFGKEPSHG